MNFKLHLGDCLETLRGMPENSVDSIVSDPPYGLSQHKPDEVLECLKAWIAGDVYQPKGKGFMGKSWDAWVPGPEVWRECLRVLKPGGHVLAFAGTRSMDLMSMAIRLAGFELRDSVGFAHDGGGAPLLAWAFGSGFPKSMDVSKAIDKMDASEEQHCRRLKFTAWVRSQSVTSRQIDDATGTNMGCHYTTAASQPAIMTREHLEKCRHLFREVPNWVEQEADKRSVESRNMAGREVIGKSENGIAGGSGKHAGQDGAYGFGAEYDITAPATEAARQWEGWGTALKPAWEPIILARKPLSEGTVAANVLAHGTGALNIDGCRAGDGKDVPASVSRASAGNSLSGSADGSLRRETGKESGHNPNIGRWPANLIHSGEPEVVAGFPSEKQGSAARFFYCAKASKRDRDEGLEGFAQVAAGAMDGNSGRSGSRTAGDGVTPIQQPVRSNIHPTVKPTDLMAYLVRLVTPPGGTVLDPFMGSGSTGKAAMREGLNFIGCELSSEYMEIARARIAHELEKSQRKSAEVAPQLDLFASEPAI